jgi:hypothetical protein
MNAGDTARVKNGTYPHQRLDGDKASETFIIGESISGVRVGSTNNVSCPSPEWDPADGSHGLCIFAAHPTFRDMTIDSGPQSDNPGNAIRSFWDAHFVTLENVNIEGNQPTLMISGTNFTWDGGNHGTSSHVPFRTCDDTSAQPIQIQEEDGHDASNATFNNIIAWPWTVQEDVPGPSCGGDNTPHLEFFRLQGTNDNVTISNITFKPGGEWGSGYIFSSGAAASTGWKLINIFFPCNEKLGPGDCGGQWQDNNPGSPCTTIYAYNTWVEGFTGGAVNDCDSSSVWVGNVGPDSVTGCGGTHIKNVWPGSGSCGTDTFTGGPPSGLGIDSNGNLEVGSPAIDAAETPGASDYCTDPTYANSRDFEATVRPQGSICDAGSDER